VLYKGSWGGAGTTKAKPKPHLIKKVAGVDPKSRADYGKGHVIISEKKDKKAAKYLVKDLPYPYTSKAQFERRMEQPLGPEWNTRVGFQKGTLPKVVKKACTSRNFTVSLLLIERNSNRWVPSSILWRSFFEQVTSRSSNLVSGYSIFTGKSCMEK